ncbi:MAG: hypothetical protein M0P31_01150 [Solirubrobacteraceae bacterium]|nr:hypothetical protein [Solirubrobacteraceae bacterium]
MSAPAPRILLIPDGLADPWPPRPGDAARTTLDRTPTLALDAVARRGAVRPVRTTPDGLPPGSEVGLPSLLGGPPHGVVSRGRVDAAAHGALEPDLAVVHRVDVRWPDGRAAPELAGIGLSLLRASVAEEGLHVLALGGHRLLVMGHVDPVLPRRADLAELAIARGLWNPDDRPQDGPAGAEAGGGAARIGGVPSHDGPWFQLWPDGVVPPRILDADTVVVCAKGSTMAGVATLMGARTLHPPGTTGRPGTDVAAKARAAVTLLREGASTVVVHVGSPDEAAHARDPQAKARELSRIDRDLVAPLAGIAMDLGATLAVCPDHGTDPVTGVHSATPVPGLVWRPGIAPSGPDRLTEPGVADLAPVAGPWVVR